MSRRKQQIINKFANYFYFHFKTLFLFSKTTYFHFRYPKNVMAKEFKHFSFTNVKSTDETSPRIKTGICAVSGNIDSWGDRIHFGAFAKTLNEGAKRVRHLWNHNGSQPPIATILELKEIGRDELPAEVLEKAPEATGGLLVKREYYDNPFANWILEGINKGDINEMSFAYNVVKATETVEETGFDDMPKRYIRELLELKLFDTSDVNWGMNMATVASGAKGFEIEKMSLGQICSQFKALQAEIKDGRRNSEADQILLDNIHQLSIDLGAKCDKEPDSTAGKEAEAAENGTSLNADWFEQSKRKIELFNY